MLNGSTLLTTGSSILAAGFFMNVLLVIWVISAVPLVLIILIQKGKGGGLSSAFGGGMATNLLGANTKKPLTWFTIGLVGVFLLLAILLAKYYPMSSSDLGPVTPPAARQPAGQPASTAPTGTAIPKTTPDMNSGR